jgi:hypothetical protein
MAPYTTAASRPSFASSWWTNSAWWRVETNTTVDWSGGSISRTSQTRAASLSSGRAGGWVGFWLGTGEKVRAG